MYVTSDLVSITLLLLRLILKKKKKESIDTVTVKAGMFFISLLLTLESMHLDELFH